MFVLGFLPAAYILFLFAFRLGGWAMAIRFLGLASLAYYAQFGILPVVVLAFSVVANFVLGRVLLEYRTKIRNLGYLLVFAIVANLVMLGYFKYSNILIDIANQLSGQGFSHLHIILPIGISFFTFIQIGYLIEAYNGDVERQSFSRYLVFSTFFPCIAAGPLVLQREIFSQMSGRKDRAWNPSTLSVGLTLFGIGLFKKCFLADSIAPYANTVFDGVSAGMGIDPVTAWVGALCYTLQLYFDFSGYSDMAIALGLIFGIRLPLNFNSPFKATNISDFWRRWHMTMTRFFTTFIYTPLAMKGMRETMQNGADPLTKYIKTAATPAIVTFLVAGIWHGDGLTFLVYGLIHGFAIAIYLGWRELKIDLPMPLSWMLTMSVVVTGLVVFRADTLSTASTMLGQMWLPTLLGVGDLASMVSIDLRKAISFIVVFGAIVLLMPNSQQILHREWVSSDPKPPETERSAGFVVWRPRLGQAVPASIIFCIALSSLGASSTFLYYQF
jgi:D-alanyl-lipoteichoic acid acyltransferase DltB (MBOAT superfamily)